MDLWLKAQGQPKLLKPTRLADLLKRHELNFDLMVEGTGRTPPQLDPELREHLSIECRYEGYIRRQRESVERIEGLRNLAIPPSMVFEGIPGLRPELVEKLELHRPATLGGAAAISGMTPAAVALLASRIQRMGARHESRM
jgi:tRNA uridine 5-carboxymethylaminomethyl modification enzyme